MKVVRVLLLSVWLLAGWAYGQNESAPTPAPASAAAAPAARTDTEAAPASDPAKTGPEAQRDLNNKAAAAVQSGRAHPQTPDFLEHLVDAILAAFDVRSTGNTTTHYVISGLFLLLAFVLRHILTKWIFGIFKHLASRTKTTLDDKLFPALETPVATLLVVIGLVAALKVLKLPAETDYFLDYAYTVAFSLVVFWILLRGFNTVLDHAGEVARERKMGIAAFMPWIKKTLVTIFVVFGILMVAQNLGADVKAFLAGLGIGGLAFALAAQDTLANVFGSVVVAIDQPFKIGETVQIGAHIGAVEDIGLRSTRLRKPDKSLVTIPNKTVAAEAIVNLSRFTQRRVEQTIGLTYDSKPDQIQALVDELRALLLAQPELEKSSVIVQFTAFSASSLDIWVVFQTLDPDFTRHLEVKQRINLEIMRRVEARGLQMAFPTQTVLLEGAVARRLADGVNGRPDAPKGA